MEKKIIELREIIKKSIIENPVNDVQEGCNMSLGAIIARLDYILGDYKEFKNVKELKKYIGALSGRKPIPLTEDRLIKWGLEKRAVTKGLYDLSEYSIRNGFDIYCYMDMVGNCLIYGECFKGEDFFIIKCDKVHEFQNIFRMLTGKELNTEQ